MRLRWFLVWCIACLAIFVPIVNNEPDWVVIRASTMQALLWFVVSVGVTGFALSLFGWQRRGFPTFVGVSLILLAIFWIFIPIIWDISQKPLIFIHTESVWGFVWLVWMGCVVALAMVWVGWRLRKQFDLARRRGFIASLAQTHINDGILIMHPRKLIVWSNQLGADYFSRLNAEITRLAQRGFESRRIQTQAFALGEGERVSIQAIPQQDGTVALVLRPLQSYSDSTQFYDHFIRRLVHDMRNPLAAIIAHAGNLQTPQLPEPSQYQRTIVTIEQEAQRLTRLVDSMLFDARLSYVPIVLDHVDLRDVVEDVMFQHDERAMRDGKNIEVDMSPLPCVMDGDRDLLTRALSNLVDNSLKYSPTGSRVTISLENESSYYVIKVKDTGHGIPNDLLPDRIFEALVRGQAGQGSGLGLAIVKKIIEMHNGTIRVDSKVGEGTTMIIWLPK